MTGKLLERGEALAREARRRKLRSVVEQLRAMFGSAAIEVEDARVLVSGRGLTKRWLIDPRLRFLGGGQP